MTMTRAEQYMRESQMTPEECLEWARAYYDEHRRWPARRFRVESPTAGASRLLTESLAIRAAARYGGLVVQVIPPRKYVP